MSGLFDILEIGSRALFGSQLGLEVTGNNIANANTEGYSRQRVVFTEGLPRNTIPGMLGTGVAVEAIERYRDEFIDMQIRVQSTSYGFYAKASEVYDRLEIVFYDSLDPLGDQPSDYDSVGLNANFSLFFNIFQDLSLEPESGSNRIQAIEQGNTLAENFQSMYRQLEQLQSDLNTEILDNIDSINGIASEIASLNEQIAFAEVDDRVNANDLRDQRDQLLNELSQYINIKVVEEDNGEVNVSFNGINLVDGVAYQPLQAIIDDDPKGYVEIVYQNERSRVLTDFIDHGELGSLIEARDTTIPQYIEILDKLAVSLMGEVNKIHASNMGTTGYDEVVGFFETYDSSQALSFYNNDYLNTVQAGSFNIRVLDQDGEPLGIYTIDVDPTVDSLDDLVARIDAADGVAGGGEFSASVNLDGQLVISGEGFNSLQFQNDTSYVLAAMGINTYFTGTGASDIAVNQYLKDNNALLATSGDGTPGNSDGALGIAQMIDSGIMENGLTLEEFYTGYISTLGIESRRNSQLMETHSSVLVSLQEQQEQISGVSLDEESVNIILFQQSYTAAARLITIVDEMLDLVTNRLGIGGR